MLVTSSHTFNVDEYQGLSNTTWTGVVGLDNFNDYYPVSLKRARQARGEMAGVYTVDGDINDVDLVRKLFATCRFTHVLHLAAQAGVRYATRNPYSYVHANLGGQVALLEVIKEQRPLPALVYASSSSVYGLNTKQPFSEVDRVDAPASLYAATKRVGGTHATMGLCCCRNGWPTLWVLGCCNMRILQLERCRLLRTHQLQADELIAHVYFNIHKISVTGLRFFTVYGPWGRPDMAAYKFAVAIVKGEPIKIFKVRVWAWTDSVQPGCMRYLPTRVPPCLFHACHRDQRARSSSVTLPL